MWVVGGDELPMIDEQQQVAILGLNPPPHHFLTIVVDRILAVLQPNAFADQRGGDEMEGQTT